MKTLLIKIFLLLFFFLPKSGYADSSVYSHEESESSIHELPKADQCSVITMNIRQQAFSLKKVVKEISSLEASVHSSSENSDPSEQHVNEYEQNLDALKNKASNLRKQIDMQEQQLEYCYQHDKNPTD